MVTIENIRDLEKYLSKHFSNEPTVNVHIVTGERPGGTVAVEIIPDTPGDEPLVAFFSLTFGGDGHTDGILGIAYDHWGPENSSPLWWQNEYGVCLGYITSDRDNSGAFDDNGLSDYMVRVFGTLWHSKRSEQTPAI